MEEKTEEKKGKCLVVMYFVCVMYLVVMFLLII